MESSDGNKTNTVFMFRLGVAKTDVRDTLNIQRVLFYSVSIFSGSGDTHSVHALRMHFKSIMEVPLRTSVSSEKLTLSSLRAVY